MYDLVRQEIEGAGGSMPQLCRMATVGFCGWFFDARDTAVGNKDGFEDDSIDYQS